MQPVEIVYINQSYGQGKVEDLDTLEIHKTTTIGYPLLEKENCLFLVQSMCDNGERYNIEIIPIGSIIDKKIL